MEDRLKEHIKYIKSLPAFNELEDKDIIHLLRHDNVFNIVSYEPNERLITEKQLDRKIFLLIKGRVNISKDVLAGDCKKEKHISTVEGSGHFIGEISAITGKPRTASVTALAKTICVVIDIALLMEASSTLLGQVKSKLYPKLFELLGKRLEETNQCMVALKQQVEDLENKILNVMQEKYQLKQNHREELRERNLEIKSLQDKLAKFNLM